MAGRFQQLIDRLSSSFVEQSDARRAAILGVGFGLLLTLVLLLICVLIFIVIPSLR